MSNYVKWGPRRNSWHTIRLTRSIQPQTLCGRTAGEGFEVRDTLPAQRSCENCLRISARQAERP